MLTFTLTTCGLAFPAGLLWTASYMGIKEFSRQNLLRIFLISSGIGLVIAVTQAWLRQTTAWMNLELMTLAFNGLLVIALALFLTALRHINKSEPDQIYSSFLTYFVPFLSIIIVCCYVPQLALVTTGLVSLGAPLLSTESVENTAGFIFANSLVSIALWSAYRAGIQAPQRIRLIVTSAITALAIVIALIKVVQILLGRRIISVPSPVFKVVAWLLNHDSWFSFAMAALLIVPIVAAVITQRRSRVLARNPAEERLQRAAIISRRRFIVSTTVGFALIGSTLILGKTFTKAEPELSPEEKFVVDGDNIRVDLAQISDGHLHRFSYQTTLGVGVRFIVVQKNAKAFGVGLDACNVCGPTGYYERNGQVICKMCDVAMNIATIGFKGGCNPIPLEHKISDGQLVVSCAVLENCSDVFK